MEQEGVGAGYPVPGVYNTWTGHTVAIKLWHSSSHIFSHVEGDWAGDSGEETETAMEFSVVLEKDSLFRRVYTPDTEAPVLVGCPQADEVELESDCTAVGPNYAALCSATDNHPTPI